MTYLNYNDKLHRGYNVYIDETTNQMGTMMNVGLLVMEDGDTYTYESQDHEVAILLFEGKVTYAWDGKTVKEAKTMKVDGRTGATMSSDAIKENVKRALEYYEKNT